jgi:hypothetical protein
MRALLTETILKKQMRRELLVTHHKPVQVLGGVAPMIFAISYL